MIAIKAKLKITGLDKVQTKIKNQFVNDVLVRDFQTIVVRNIIIDFIKKGISPVKGFGRFGEYVNPANYPGLGKSRQKPKRPVNLTLTGDMLNAITTRKASGTSLNVGIDPNASTFIKTKAIANNEGTVTKSGVGAIPRRRFIPVGNEEWAVSVIRGATNLFTERLKQLLSK